MTYDNAEGWRKAAAAELASDDTCANCLGGSSTEFPCHECNNTGHTDKH